MYIPCVDNYKTLSKPKILAVIDGITISKVSTGIFRAECEVYRPLKVKVRQEATTRAKAVKKLKLYLDGKPYKHITEKQKKHKDVKL